MSFENNKKMILSKKDKSNIGSIDEPIKELVDLINSKPNYFTTSSCSGRIIIIKHSSDGRKDKSEKLFVSHEQVDADDMINLLKAKETSDELPDEELWFRMEGFILHVCCRTIEDAEKLMDIAKSSGLNLKRTGISSLSNIGSRITSLGSSASSTDSRLRDGKIIVEVLSAEILDCPISKNRKLSVDEDYLKLLAESANKKLEKNRKKIEEIKKLISSF